MISLFSRSLIYVALFSSQDVHVKGGSILIAPTSHVVRKWILEKLVLKAKLPSSSYKVLSILQNTLFWLLSR